MNTPIKTLTILAAVTSVALAAGAQQQERNAQPDRRQAGFNCPTCGSPCISKAQAVRMHRQVNAHQQQFRTRPQAPFGQNGPRANMRQPQRNNPPARMQQRDNLHNRKQPPQEGIKRNRQEQERDNLHNRKQPPQEGAKRNRQEQQSLRFDLDGDGTLSPAERAALKAYRNELRRQHGEKPAKQPPVD